jgi:hypothetical protein
VPTGDEIAFVDDHRGHARNAPGLPDAFGLADVLGEFPCPQDFGGRGAIEPCLFGRFGQYFMVSGIEALGEICVEQR